MPLVRKARRAERDFERHQKWALRGMLSPGDANTALRLVARELAKDLDVIEFTDSVRVNALRKVLSERFGAKAWDVTNKRLQLVPMRPSRTKTRVTVAPE